MLLEISLSRNCSGQYKVSDELLKALIEGEAACSHRVRLAGILKTMAESMERTQLICEKKYGFIIISFSFILLFLFLLSLRSLTLNGQLICEGLLCPAAD